MIKAILIGGSLALGLGLSASAQTSLSPTMQSDAAAPMTAPQFITAASQSDEFEIREGQMAQSMGASPSVRQFGAKMVHDHTMTTDNLHAAIMKAGMPVPPPPPLRPDQEQMVAQLRSLSGPAFDKAYLQQQVQAHKEALQTMTNYGKNGNVPSIKMAAAKTAPIVRSHLQMATRLEAKMSSM